MNSRKLFAALMLTVSLSSVAQDAVPAAAAEAQQ
jgi:hypothetical protein